MGPKWLLVGASYLLLIAVINCTHGPNRAIGRAAHGSTDNAQKHDCPVEHAIEHVEHHDCPVEHAIEHAEHHDCPVEHAIAHAEHHDCPVEKAIEHAESHDCPVEHTIEHAEHHDCPVEHAIKHAEDHDCPVENAIQHAEHHDCPVEHAEHHDCPVEHAIEHAEHHDCPVEHAIEHADHHDCPVQHAVKHVGDHDCPIEHVIGEVLNDVQNHDDHDCPVEHAIVNIASDIVKTAHDSTGQDQIQHIVSDHDCLEHAAIEHIASDVHLADNLNGAAQVAIEHECPTKQAIGHIITDTHVNGDNNCAVQHAIAHIVKPEDHDSPVEHVLEHIVKHMTHDGQAHHAPHDHPHENEKLNHREPSRNHGNIHHLHATLSTLVPEILDSSASSVHGVINQLTPFTDNILKIFSLQKIISELHGPNPHGIAENSLHLVNHGLPFHPILNQLGIQKPIINVTVRYEHITVLVNSLPWLPESFSRIERGDGLPEIERIVKYFIEPCMDIDQNLGAQALRPLIEPHKEHLIIILVTQLPPITLRNHFGIQPRFDGRYLKLIRSIKPGVDVVGPITNLHRKDLTDQFHILLNSDEGLHKVCKILYGGLPIAPFLDHLPEFNSRYVYPQVRSLLTEQPLNDVHDINNLHPGIIEPMIHMIHHTIRMQTRPILNQNPFRDNFLDVVSSLPVLPLANHFGLTLPNLEPITPVLRPDHIPIRTSPERDHFNEEFILPILEAPYLVRQEQLRLVLEYNIEMEYTFMLTMHPNPLIRTAEERVILGEVIQLEELSHLLPILTPALAEYTKLPQPCLSPGYLNLNPLRELFKTHPEIPHLLIQLREGHITPNDLSTLRNYLSLFPNHLYPVNFELHPEFIPISDISKYIAPYSLELEPLKSLVKTHPQIPHLLTKLQNGKITSNELQHLGNICLEPLGIPYFLYPEELSFLPAYEILRHLDSYSPELEPFQTIINTHLHVPHLLSKLTTGNISPTELKYLGNLCLEPLGVPYLSPLSTSGIIPSSKILGYLSHFSPENEPLRSLIQLHPEIPHLINNLRNNVITPAEIKHLGKICFEPLGIPYLLYPELGLVPTAQILTHFSPLTLHSEPLRSLIATYPHIPHLVTKLYKNIITPMELRQLGRLCLEPLGIPYLAPLLHPSEMIPTAEILDQLSHYSHETEPLRSLIHHHPEIPQLIRNLQDNYITTAELRKLGRLCLEPLAIPYLLNPEIGLLPTHQILTHFSPLTLNFEPFKSIIANHPHIPHLLTRLHSNLISPLELRQLGRLCLEPLGIPYLTPPHENRIIPTSEIISHLSKFSPEDEPLRNLILLHPEIPDLITKVRGSHITPAELRDLGMFCLEPLGIPYLKQPELGLLPGNIILHNLSPFSVSLGPLRNIIAAHPEISHLMSRLQHHVITPVELRQLGKLCLEPLSIPYLAPLYPSDVFPSSEILGKLAHFSPLIEPFNSLISLHPEIPHLLKKLHDNVITPIELRNLGKICFEPLGIPYLIFPELGLNPTNHLYPIPTKIIPSELVSLTPNFFTELFQLSIVTEILDEYLLLYPETHLPNILRKTNPLTPFERHYLQNYLGLLPNQHYFKVMNPILTPLLSDFPTKDVILSKLREYPITTLPCTEIAFSQVPLLERQIFNRLPQTVGSVHDLTPLQRLKATFETTIDNIKPMIDEDRFKELLLYIQNNSCELEYPLIEEEINQIRTLVLDHDKQDIYIDFLRHLPPTSHTVLLQFLALADEERLLYLIHIYQREYTPNIENHMLGAELLNGVLSTNPHLLDIFPHETKDSPAKVIEDLFAREFSGEHIGHSSLSPHTHRKLSEVALHPGLNLVNLEKIGGLIHHCLDLSQFYLPADESRLLQTIVFQTWNTLVGSLEVLRLLPDVCTLSYDNTTRKQLLLMISDLLGRNLMTIGEVIRLELRLPFGETIYHVMKKTNQLLTTHGSPEVVYESLLSSFRRRACENLCMLN